MRNVGTKGHLEPFYSRGCTCVDSFQCWEGHQKGTTIRRKSLDYPRDTIISFVTWCVCLRYHSLSAFREMESQGKKCVMLSFFSYLHKCLGTGAWIIEDDKKYLYLILECTAILTYIVYEVCPSWKFPLKTIERHSVTASLCWSCFLVPPICSPAPPPLPSWSFPSLTQMAVFQKALVLIFKCTFKILTRLELGR